MNPADPRNGNDHGRTGEPDPVERAYRALGPEEPPELLDQAVLNRARHEVEGRRAWPWTLGWYHGLGTAASVLLVVTVFLQMRQEAPKLPMPNSPPSAAPAEGRDENFEAGDLGAAGVLQESAAGADRSAQLKVLSKDADDAKADNLELDAVTEQKNEAAPAGQDGFVDFAEPTPAVSAPAAREPMDYRADAEEEPARHRLEEARQLLDALEAEIPVAEDAAQSSGAEKSRAGEREMMQQSMDAETWIGHLHELKAAGEEEAFTASLEAFREAYPDYPLPEDWGGE